LGYAKYIPLEDIVATCEQLYTAHGFVKWADVAKVHDISRQGVLNRLQSACDRGDLPPDTLDRWRSTSARAAQSRSNETLRRENDRLRFSMTLTPENKRWLDAECVARKCRSADIVNGLINKAREGRE
jgi:hypothetical protein